METERQIRRPAPVPQLLEAIRERMPNPVRFGLYLVLASTPISLRICAIEALVWFDLRCGQSASDRGRPVLTGG
jgi:hypothetical protein